MLTSEALISVLPLHTERVYIAFSGGLDSHVLLHLASISSIRSKIKAVYVNHGLQDEADLWEKHCESISLSLNVEFQCIRVNAQKVKGQSPEEAARNARYHVLKPLLTNHDVLLLAQHREDQLETVLLQLFRGAGVQGLSGMPLSIAFGSGILCRPFLDIPKQKIKEYASYNNLSWIEDPSNECNDFDRNFLRNNILPRLKQRWPALDKTIARSARHCSNLHNLTQDLASDLLNSLYDKTDKTLNISRLLELDINKQQLVIRQWLSHFQLRMPSENIVQKILSEVVLAKVCGKPKVQGKEYSIRRYRNKLYCLRSCLTEEDLIEQQWSTEQMQCRLSNGQLLVLLEATEGVSKKKWLESKISVRFRKGGEKINLKGRGGHHELKKLFQEKGIPPWERKKIPLIYLDEKLAVVVGLWTSADFLSSIKEECYQICNLEGE